MNEELTLEASIELLLDQVPGPVRAFVLNELASTTGALMQRFNLHVDHAGVLERELLLMLLGQESPEEFVAALTEAGIPEATVRDITTDINQNIFMRLRAEERKAETKPSAPSAKPLLPPAVAPIKIEAHARPAAREVPPPPNLPGQTPPPAPRPVPPPVHQAAPAPQPVAAQPAAPVPDAAPAHDSNTRIIHTMARDMQALKGGEDPFRVAHPAPPAWAQAPTPQQPAPAEPAPAPRPTMPPPAASKPELITPPAPRANEPLREHLKQYGVDPYREPVE